MDPVSLAARAAECCRPDDGVSVSVLRFADGVAVLLKDMPEVAAAVAAECRTEDERTALGRSQDGETCCVVCPSEAAFDAVRCRLAEELHFYDGLDSPFAADAGLFVFDRRRGRTTTLAAFAATLADEPD